MFDLSVHWLVTALDASIKAGLIALVAAVGLRLLRVGDSNLRHRVWTGVLVGMMALPALSQVMPALRLPFAIDLVWIVTRWERERSAVIMAAEKTPVSENASVIPPAESDPSTTESLALLTRDPTAELTTFSGFGADSRPPEFQYGPPGMARWESGRFVSGDELPTTFADADLSTATGRESPRVETGELVIAPQPAAVVRTITWFDRFVARWPQWVFVFWGVGTIVLLIRLLLALLSGRWLLSRAHFIDAVELEDLGLSSQLLTANGQPVPLLECERLRVPITLGWYRPRILLPLDWIEWPAEKLAAVLTHERTHVERRDCTVMFLAELNRCVAWFHPLAWWLKRHLSNLAEAACDDAVIDSIGDRATYARHLLEVASVVSRHRGRVLTTGVSMARRSNVEHRIHSILDSGRPLTQRLTRATALLLVAIIVPVIALAAALRPAVRDAPASETVALADDLRRADETEPLVALADDEAVAPRPDGAPKVVQIDEPAPDEETGPITVWGIVTDTDQKPITGAKVFFAFERTDADNFHELGQSGPDGRFVLTLPDEVATMLRTGREVYSLVLVAQAEGYAIDRMPIWAFEVKGLRHPPWTAHPAEVDAAFGAGRLASQSLRLSPLAETVRGKLLSLEGQPLAGVQVLVEDLYDVDIPTLNEALANVSNEQVRQALSTATFAGRYSTHNSLQHLFPVVTTDEQGEFVLPGIGRDQVAVVTLLGEHVESERLHFIGRDRPSVAVPHLSSYPNGAKDHYFGTSFTHVVAPGVPIVGVVREYLSGRPIADAEVFVERLFSKEDFRKLDSKLRLFTRHIRTRTDAEGRYRLLGVPPGDAHVLNVIAPTTQPWLIAQQSLDVPADEPEVTQDIQIVRGIWIEGNLIDADTDQPLRGAVDYFSFKDNPHSPTQLGLADAFQLHRFSTDGDGHFRVAGLPGQGVVGAVTFQDHSYPRSVGLESIDGYDGNEYYIPTLSHWAPFSNWNLLRQIEVPNDVESFHCDMALSKGTLVPGRAVAPDGAAISDLKALGLAPRNEFWSDQQESRFEVAAYDPAIPRELFFKSSDNKLVGHLRLEGPAPKELVVKLQQAVTVTGRLIARETDEPAVDYSINCQLTNQGKFRFEEQLHTDSDGRFTIPGLLAGLKYHTSTANPQHFSSGKNNFVIDLTDSKPGDTIDLGDVRGQDKQARGAAMSAGDNKPSAVNSSGPWDSSTPAADTVFQYRGTVVDEAGRPLEGAEITLNYWRKSADSLEPPLAITSSDGTFQFSRNKSDFADGGEDTVWSYAMLVAVKDGYGFAARPSLAFESTGRAEALLPERSRQYLAEQKKSWTNKLTLPADLPVRGRIVNTEGQPVAGATVEPINIWEGESGSLEDWLAEAKRPQANYYSARNHLSRLAHGNFVDGPHWSVIPPVTTNADGWFTLNGLGRERIAEVLIGGPGIESTKTYLRSQPGEIIKLSKSERGDDLGDDTYYPSEFTHVAGPSQAVSGRITDAQTGHPIAGVRVRSDRLAGREVGGILAADFIHTVTDADGRYRLEGLPLGENQFLALPPKGTAYLAGQVAVSTAVGEPELARDVRLTSGVLVRGRAIDGATGAPLRGHVESYVFSNNPQIKQLPTRLGGDTRNVYLTDADGRFEIPVLPGPGILTFMADDHEKYPRGAGADRIDGPSQMIGLRAFETYPSYCIPSNVHALVGVDFEPDAGPQTIDFQLGSGASIPGRIVNTAGQPLTDCFLFGEHMYSSWYPHEPAEFSIEGYFPREGRRLSAFHPATNAIGELTLSGDAPQGPLVLKLDQQAGQVVGRLLDADGEPIAGARLNNATPIRFPLAGDEQSNTTDPDVRHFIDRLDSRAIVTDADGRFTLIGLLPDKRYSAEALGLRKIGDRNYPTSLGKVFTDVTVQPGETKDLGDLTPEPEESQAVPSPVNTVNPQQDAKPAATPNGGASIEADSHAKTLLRGVVKDAAGDAVPGARVAAVGRRMGNEQGGDLTGRGEVLAAGVADGQGRYSLTLENVSAATHADVDVIAMADGFGLAWREFDPAAAESELNLTLVPELPIRLRLIDTEGQPAAGVSFKITTLTAPDFSQGNRDEVGFWGTGFRDQAPAECWPMSFTTDDDGRCTITGVAPGVGLFAKTDGNEALAAQFIRVVSRDSDDETRDPESKALVVPPDEVGDVVLAPAQIFAGVVRYEDTGEPAANARLTIYSRSSDHGSTGIGGNTDNQGRYRINAYPGQTFTVSAYPPAGKSYLVRHLNEVKCTEAERVKTLDLTLAPGVLAAGRIVEAGSQQPIAEAAVQYIPKRRNKFDNDQIITGWPGTRTSSAEGRFEIVIPPGPGTLVFHGPRGEFLLRETMDQQLYDDKPGGVRNYANAFREVDLQPGETLDPMEVQLERGRTVKGTLVDEANQPIEKGLMIARRNIYSFHLQWRGIAEEVQGGRFERHDLAPGETQAVYFVDPERRIGATATLTSDEPAPRLVLRPCGSAKYRMVDKDGQPVADSRVSVAMVLAAGCSPYAFQLFAQGQVAADEGLIDNIDRRNHWDLPPSGADGVVQLPALIPGATYRLYRPIKGFEDYIDFTVASGESRDLGDVVVSEAE